MNSLGYRTSQYWHGASARHFTIEKWCSMKCRKRDVGSFDRSEVIAIGPSRIEMRNLITLQRIIASRPESHSLRIRYGCFGP